ncbi:hypothetical protein Ddye_014190 [Dipteronia dyeriana]|uniref:Uncharacterized protein n=1 Tax=Dipteronia dyeriana TaxID=168575 RepID=A0AAD9X7N9_9ROSI|nr:hypothetical protein Ddye_014190 [Dipteronia dyeriana]
MNQNQNQHGCLSDGFREALSWQAHRISVQENIEAALVCLPGGGVNAASNHCGWGLENIIHALMWCPKAKEEFERSQKLLSTNPPLQSHAVSVCWSPPPMGSLKLNSNAAVKPEVAFIGVGAIIRDELGGLVAALAKPLLGSFPVDDVNIVSRVKSSCLDLSVAMLALLRRFS